jgi:hypothetical protein
MPAGSDETKPPTDEQERDQESKRDGSGYLGAEPGCDNQADDNQTAQPDDQGYRHSFRRNISFKPVFHGILMFQAPNPIGDTSSFSD